MEHTEREGNLAEIVRAIRIRDRLSRVNGMIESMNQGHTLELGMPHDELFILSINRVLLDVFSDFGRQRFS